MDSRKAIIRYITYYVAIMLIIVSSYTTKGISVNDALTEGFEPMSFMFAYVSLFNALIDFYDFLKNRKKQVYVILEYIRLSLAFLFVVVFIHNVFFV